jgi:hypothetical protein
LSIPLRCSGSISIQPPEASRGWKGNSRLLLRTRGSHRAISAKGQKATLLCLGLISAFTPRSRHRVRGSSGRSSQGRRFTKAECPKHDLPHWLSGVNSNVGTPLTDAAHRSNFRRKTGDFAHTPAAQPAPSAERLHHPLHRGMLAVIQLYPVLRPAWPDTGDHGDCSRALRAPSGIRREIGRGRSRRAPRSSPTALPCVQASLGNAAFADCWREVTRIGGKSQDSLLDRNSRTVCQSRHIHC